MPKIEQKQVIINEIKDKLSKASSAVLVNSIGLTVAEDTELRKRLKEANVDYKVYKNTMMNFAIKDTPFEGLKEYLEGPSTLALSYDNPVAAASVINEEAKKFKNLQFKAGIVEGILYDADGIKVIAEIPSRDVLLSRFIGSLQSPIAAFARVTKAVAEKKDENKEQETQAE